MRAKAFGTRICDLRYQPRSAEKVVLIIKKTIALIFCLCIMLQTMPAAYAQTPDVSARNAVLMSECGQVIFEKNADKQALIASTTKIMTAIIAIERLDSDAVVEIAADCCGIEGSSMYLKPGEHYSVDQLLKGLMLVSGNDAALALACCAAGTVEEFVALMNEKAAQLQMHSTSFVNPHGLNAEGHYSSAGDMAKLMAYCMKNPRFAELSALRSCTVGEQTLVNHNKLLNELEGCVAGKTGYTKAAGRCLVSCCRRGDTGLICVTLSAPDDWNDHKKLYEWGFSKFCRRNAAEGLSFTVPLTSVGGGALEAVPEESLWVFVPREAELEACAELPRFVFPPVNAGERAGNLKILYDGNIIAECRLVYAEAA